MRARLVRLRSFRREAEHLRDYGTSEGVQRSWESRQRRQTSSEQLVQQGQRYTAPGLEEARAAMDRETDQWFQSRHGDTAQDHRDRANELYSRAAKLPDSDPMKRAIQEKAFAHSDTSWQLK